MNVYLYQKLAYRYDTPSDRSTDGHLKKLTRRLVAQLEGYKGAELPQVGDVYYIGNTPYEIKRRIFIDNNGDNILDTVVCEVVVFNSNYTCTHGSDTWTEDIPLVVELPDEGEEVNGNDGQRSTEDSRQ